MVTKRYLIRAMLRSPRDHVSRGTRALRRAGVPDARLEAEVLLRRALGVGRAEFLSMLYSGDRSVSEAQAARFRALLCRRLSGEPLAYIVGRREFYGIEIEVSEATLIPRQETELLVEIALERIADAESARVADVGTGSGAVALAITAHSGREASIVATDVSAAALDVARRNAARLGLSDRIEFVHCDTLDAASGPFDIVVSNPPYIPGADIDGLAAEVRREPRIALDGGADGLDPFRKLIAQADSKLAAGGIIAVELMPEQMETARAIVASAVANHCEITTRRDLSGAERALVVRRADGIEARRRDERLMDANAA